MAYIDEVNKYGSYLQRAVKCYRKRKSCRLIGNQLEVYLGGGVDCGEWGITGERMQFSGGDNWVLNKWIVQ